MLSDFLVVFFVCLVITICAISLSQLYKVIQKPVNKERSLVGYESGFGIKESSKSGYNNVNAILFLPYILLEILLFWSLYVPEFRTILLIIIIFISRFFTRNY